MTTLFFNIIFWRLTLQKKLSQCGFKSSHASKIAVSYTTLLKIGASFFDVFIELPSLTVN